MKKILLIIFLIFIPKLSFAGDCPNYKPYSGFVYFDGKKGTVIKGMDSC